MKKWIPALKSVKEELKDCIEANKNVSIGDWMQWLHHGEPIEKTNEPIMNRINYVVENKPPREIRGRLRAMRPASSKQVKAYADYQAKRAPLDADYEAKRDALWNDYAKVYCKNMRIEKAEFLF